jgi:hypothetical protein
MLEKMLTPVNRDSCSPEFPGEDTSGILADPATPHGCGAGWRFFARVAV